MDLLSIWLWGTSNRAFDPRCRRAPPPRARPGTVKLKRIWAVGAPGVAHIKYEIG